MLVGCFSPSTGIEDVEPGVQPPGGLFGADANTGTCGTADPSPLTSMHVRVRTTTLNGKYSPRNVGAIWVESAAGMFVKTIERWGRTRARYLTRFTAASGGNIVDAVTSATLANHITHDRTWDLTNLERCEIPAGDYRIVVELTDRNGTGASIELPFTKGETPSSLMPAEAANFHDLLLELR
jgi:hypothetical protein